MRAERSRPVGTNHQAATENIAGGDRTDSTFPQPLGAVDAAGVLDGVHVVVVRVDGEHYRRRVYLNLPSANRAVARARARGYGAEVVLCQLVPAGVVR